MKYPEIFDTKNIDVWCEKYLTKEVRSREWDLMVTEELPDVFSIPFFTTEFCDKFVENIKDFHFHQSNRWGTPTDILSLDRVNLMDLSLYLVNEFLYMIGNHYWRIDGKKWEEMNIDPQILKFQPNQEIRLHHDFCSLTASCLLDDESDGGELVFEKYGTIKMRQGRIYLYPGQITHRYGMRRVKNKSRYLLNIYCYAN
jgi:hypothetical protein